MRGSSSRGGVWAHYHLCVELTPEFAASLARAYRRDRGRGIIEINNGVIGPLWRHGFTCTTFGAGPVRAALYAAAYSVSEGKESQQGLPTWYRAWCKATGKKRMHKWSFSKGFWDGEDTMTRKYARPDPKRREREFDRKRRAFETERRKFNAETEVFGELKEQRLTDVIIEGCGKRTTLFCVDVARTLVDDDTGEIVEAGWCGVPIGKVEENVETIVQVLRDNGVDVFAGDRGAYYFSPDAFKHLRRLIPGTWFGWHELKTLGWESGVQNVPT